MKILSLLSNIDAEYNSQTKSYWRYLLDALGVSDDYSKLAAISVGINKALQKDELTPEDTQRLNELLAVVNSLHEILDILTCPEDHGHVLHNWFTNQLGAVYSLAGLNKTLHNFRSAFDNKVLGVIKESHLSNSPAGVIPYIAINDTHLNKYSGSLTPYANRVGLDNIGFCFTTSKADLTKCVSRKKYPEGPVHPLVVLKSSKLYSPTMQSEAAAVLDAHAGVAIPILVKRG